MDASARDPAFQVSRLHERENRFERPDKAWRSVDK